MNAAPVLKNTETENLSLDVSARAAKAVGLHYVLDVAPGIARKRRGKSHYYISPDGTLIREQVCLERIRSLRIPPAWTDIWICTDPRGHLQATGRDARGRKQYRYHPAWNRVRNETKYDRMVAFGRSLPRIRRRVAGDLRRPGLSRDKILATVVRLLEATLIRIGNEEYARTNESFGLTTLRDRHVTVNGSTVRFEFRGKSGIRHNVDVTDRRLAHIVKQSQDLPGYELFQYIDEEGARHSITSSQVNGYLQRIAGHDCTAKDFRTWAGTVLAARALEDHETACGSVTTAKRNVARAIARVALQLGNSRAVCRKCYVHPDIVQAYLDGTLLETLRRASQRGSSRALPRLPPEEAAVLGFLQARTALVDRPANGTTRGR